MEQIQLMYVFFSSSSKASDSNIVQIKYSKKNSQKKNSTLYVLQSVFFVPLFFLYMSLNNLFIARGCLSSNVCLAVCHVIETADSWIDRWIVNLRYYHHFHIGRTIILTTRTITRAKSDIKSINREINQTKRRRWWKTSANLARWRRKISSGYWRRCACHWWCWMRNNRMDEKNSTIVWSAICRHSWQSTES